MKIEKDIWLSSIFGYDVNKISYLTDPSKVTPEIFSGQRTAFFYAKIPATSLDYTIRFSNIGFHIVDVNVVLERAVPEKVETDSKKDRTLTVADARPEDKEEVLDIASSCFIYSRFHADPFVSKTLADKIKREWMANYFAGQRGNGVLVAKQGGKRVGFLAIINSDTGGKRTRIIDLVGVDPGQKQKGIGRALVSSFIESSVVAFDLLLVGTQIANYPSLRLYEKCGFRIKEASYVLHAHLRNGDVLK